MKTKTLVRLLALSSLIAAWLVALPARAERVVWINTNGGNWSVAANWSPNQVPGASDDAVITNDGTYTVVLNVKAAPGSLTLGGAMGHKPCPSPVRR